MTLDKMKPVQAISKLVLTMTVSGMCFGLVVGCTTLQPQSPNTSVTGYGVPATDRTLAQRILDKSIINTAKTNINAIDSTLHKRSRISVDSFYSRVLLTGEVPDAVTREQVVKIVSSMPDVKQVFDRLTVGVQKGTSYTVHDGYITSKLTAKIFANGAIKKSQVQVVTDDGVVYVLGKLTPTQRGHLINIAESTVGIKELVLLTELINEYGVPIDETEVRQEVGLEPPALDGYTLTSPKPLLPSNTLKVTSVPITDNHQSTNKVVTNVANGGENVLSRSSSVQAEPATTQPVPASPNPITNQSPATTQPTTTNGTSSYIELYKHQVPGWQQQ